MSVIISGAVEGPIDRAVFERLVRLAGAASGPVHVTHGKQGLLRRLQGFNEAARRAPWLVLVDLDQDEDCAPPFLARHIARPTRLMVCRVVVRAIESWLLGDRDRFSQWFQVPLQRIPRRPDDDPDPKNAVVKLAASSRSKITRADMVPRQQSGRKVGPLYPSRLIEFIHNEGQGWRPLVAARSSASLSHCLRRLEEVVSASDAQP